ncbi:MAG: DctP family TRAP transporter solute-binding subunit [Candidatus Brocadiae bacterium]|nr:DctP family TRAP transporter solute-binding subunit [Candidatus Brocadiia bacterium]
MRRRVLLPAFALLVAAQASAATRIHLSLILGTASEWYQGADKWKEVVEKRTEGRYTVRLVPGAAFSSHSQSGELIDVQCGNLEVSLESTILLATLDKRWAVFSFPLLFPDHKTANAVCDGPVGQQMLKSLEDKGLVGLAYGVNGFRQVTNNLRPIRTPDDLRGLKIRIPQGLPARIFTHFGASAHHMNFGDLFIALRTGDMHGQENPLSVIAAARLSRVQNHVTLWDYVYDPIVLCVNKRFWDGLPEADQDVLREAAREAMNYERKLVAKADAELPKHLAEQRMAVARLTAEERAVFRKRREALRPYFEQMAGKALLAEFEQAVRAAEEATE